MFVQPRTPAVQPDCWPPFIPSWAAGLGDQGVERGEATWNIFFCRGKCHLIFFSVGLRSDEEITGYITCQFDALTSRVFFQHAEISWNSEIRKIVSWLFLLDRKKLNYLSYQENYNPFCEISGCFVHCDPVVGPAASWQGYNHPQVLVEKCRTGG